MNAQSGRQIVLITGCSSGFGELCAREFMKSGDQVIATMRDSARSNFDDNENLDVRELDVTDQQSIEQCVASVLEDYGRIDVLVNNAGIHLLGAMEDMPNSDFRKVFETNFFGAINMARAVLPSMRQQATGRIITVSSIGSMVGRVIDGAYCATKAALETAFEAMKYETERFGVQISVICPSAFRTGIAQKMSVPDKQTAESPYSALLAFRLNKVRESVAEGGNPLEVAELIQKVAKTDSPKFRYIVGEKALLMQKTLTGLSDAERQTLITRLAGVEWWVSGLEEPPQ